MTQNIENPTRALPPYLLATLEDLAGLDFEGPINGSTAADCSGLADCYRAASQALAGEPAGEDCPAERVWSFLWALTGLHFKPADTNEPFGPMMVLSDGARSAIPADFSGHVPMLAQMAVSASNPVLQARLGDICWLLDRKQVALGSQAIASYLEVVRGVEAKELRFGLDSEDQQFNHEVHDYLRRALGLGRTIGWERPEVLAARKSVSDIRKQTVAARALGPIHWYSSLDLQQGISDPADVATDLEDALAHRPADAPFHLVVDLWRLTAQAYHRAKREDDKRRCQCEAAEQLVAQSAQTPSAMLASDLLANAIAELHGVQGSKARRLELRHKLIEVQANVSDEMSMFSQEIDLTELVEKVRDRVESLTLYDALFVLAVLESTPDPEKLAEEAREAIKEHPLASIFGAAHLDDEGKVIHRTAGQGTMGDFDESVVRRQIAQAESVRRHVAVCGKIEPARHTILTTHHLTEDVFSWALQFSAFVPQDLVATFSRGFTRFFQADYTSALYILTPLLENSLRHVLKSHGHDVTKFDDATQTQQDRTISSLFEQMRPELDAVFTRPFTEEIDRVFLSKPGPSLRHDVAHGMLHDGSPYGTDAIYGCWFIFRLCFLPLFPHREQLGLV